MGAGVIGIVWVIGYTVKSMRFSGCMGISKQIFFCVCFDFDFLIFSCPLNKQIVFRRPVDTFLDRQANSDDIVLVEEE